MKTVGACLNVSVTLQCPHCDTHIDLLRSRQTNSRDHNDDGQILSQAFPDDEHWSDAHDRFEVEDVTCTECKCVFNVQGLSW